MNTKLYCLKCGKSNVQNAWKCECGGLLDIRFDPRKVDFSIDTDLQGLWRYADLLPVDFGNKISFDEGYTPIIDADNRLFYKLDYLFPTGSFKDRGASVLVSKMAEMGVGTIVEDSSGNAGASIACYAARAGMDCHIVIPASTATNKIRQVKAFGAKVHLVEGSREKAADYAKKLAEKYVYASHVYSPWFFQGTKTVAYEIREQFHFSTPANIVVPVGNGTLLIGVYKGFSDLKALGAIDELPRIVGVQAQGFDPLWQMFDKSLKELPVTTGKHTLAAGIGIKQPARYQQVLEAIKSSKGCILNVTEQSIQEALTNLHHKGLYVEPTSAVVEAAYSENYHLFSDTLTVLVLTGSGLKN